ncbi:MAG: hypothetical protein ACI4VE_05680 [Clostridia bacterium]
MNKSELFYEEESKTARPHKYSINYKEKDKFENEWIFAEKTILEKNKEIEHLQNLINKTTNYYLKTLAKNKLMPDEAVEMFNLLEGNK